MIVRTTFSAIILCFSVCASAQISDDFSDGDFTNNPTWTSSNKSGDGADFQITDQRLVSKGPASTEKISISTSNNVNWETDSVAWSVVAGYYDAGSNSNFIEIHLMANKSDLLGSPEGYYIRMGENGSADGIDLFKTSSSTPIIEDLGNLVATKIDTVRLLITRNPLGAWTVSVDLNAGTNYELIGSVTDTEFTSGSHFGFVVGHSVSRFDDYLFDDVQVAVTTQPDLTPPSLTNVEVINATQLLVDFSEKLDEATAETISNYVISGISISKAEIMEEDSSQVLLTVSGLNNGGGYELIVNNVQDKSGNVIATNSTIPFEYFLLEIPGKRDIVINEFTVDPSPPIGLPEAEFVELFNPTESYFDLSGFRIKEVAGTGSVELSAELGDFVLAPNAYVLITGLANVDLFVPYGDVLGVSGFPAFNQSNSSVALINAAHEIIDQVIYTFPPINGVTFEQINPFASCNSELNYTASVALTGGTPGGMNSVFDDTPDTQAPFITSYELGNSNRITVNFNEPMDSLSLVNGSYDISGLSISQVNVSGSYYDQLTLVFTASFEEGAIYKLDMAGVADCSGNELSTSLTFGLGRKPTFNELLITEIMADEDPVLTSLPDAEYVEIYNNSDAILSLLGVGFTDLNDTSELRDRNINPGEYLVLCANADEEDFAGFGAAMGVSGFPSLSNGGEPLALIWDSLVISSVVYQKAWHGEGRDDGGYSLELKDVNNPCGGRLVWGSSESVNGGTPGEANSISENIPDNFGPELMEAVVSDSVTLILKFNEPLDLGVQDFAQITTQPSLSIVSVEQNAIVRDFLTVKFAQTLEVNKVYEITIDNIHDCNGNLISEGNSTFVRPDKPKALEVLINEVLFDPRTGGVDFVEIYNYSEKYFDLKGWSLGRKVDDSLTQVVAISQKEKVINPLTYLALTVDGDILSIQYPKGKRENFIEMSGFPTYPNEEGTVVLLDVGGNVLDEFSYSEDYHSSLLASVDGVSLERISFDDPAQSPDNWASAASTVGFATPGYVNSQSFEIPEADGKLTVEPKVFVPGSGGSLAIQNFTTINYQFDRPGKFANVQIYDQGGRLVRELASGESLATSGFMRWDGTNNQGAKVRMGYYLVLFEVYEATGRKNVLKETVVVGWQ